MDKRIYLVMFLSSMNVRNTNKGFFKLFWYYFKVNWSEILCLARQIGISSNKGQIPKRLIQLEDKLN